MDRRRRPYIRHLHSRLISFSACDLIVAALYHSTCGAVNTSVRHSVSSSVVRPCAERAYVIVGSIIFNCNDSLVGVNVSASLVGIVENVSEQLHLSIMTPIPATYAVLSYHTCNNIAAYVTYTHLPVLVFCSGTSSLRTSPPNF